MYTPHNIKTAVAYVNGAAEAHYAYGTEATRAELARAKDILAKMQGVKAH
tara:strand:- start:776 stop:925 length:150 start_codon:yes stop_codon:yes gene_type:complete